MWKKVLEYGQQIFALTQDVFKLKRDVAQIQKELADLNLLVRDLIIQMNHHHDIAQRDQRILILELQHQLDLMEKRLAPPK